MAAMQSCDLSRCAWFGVARQVLGLEGPDAEGGESLPGAPESAQLSLEQGRPVHFMGAVGDAALGQGVRIVPTRAGALLAAVGGMWRALELNKKPCSTTACIRRSGGAQQAVFLCAGVSRASHILAFVPRLARLSYLRSHR